MGGLIKVILRFFYLVILTVAFALFMDCSSGQPTFDDLNSNENIIIVDSIPLSNSVVYWFCIDLGIRGYSIGKVGIAKTRTNLINDYELIAVSDGITAVTMSNDTLEIFLLEGYELKEKEINRNDVSYLRIVLNNDYNGLIINRIEGNIEFPTHEIENVD